MFAEKTLRPENGVAEQRKYPEIRGHDAVEGKKCHLEEVHKDIDESHNAANVEDRAPSRETKLELGRMIDRTKAKKGNDTRESRGWRTPRQGRDKR